jgi:hypothetical protein
MKQAPLVKVIRKLHSSAHYLSNITGGKKQGNCLNTQKKNLGACLGHRFSSGLGYSPRCRSALCLSGGSAGNVLWHTLRRPWRKKLSFCIHKQYENGKPDILDFRTVTNNLYCQSAISEGDPTILLRSRVGRLLKNVTVIIGEYVSAPCICKRGLYNRDQY